MDRTDAHSGTWVVRPVLAALTFIALTLTSAVVHAQSDDTPGAAPQSTQPQAVAPAPPALQSPAPPTDGVAQMRTDLDRMESLLGNMSSEIEFLRDQNLQILLRTNAQMWTLLIRDLRRQLDREEQRQTKRQSDSDRTAPQPH